MLPAPQGVRQITGQQQDSKRIVTGGLPPDRPELTDYDRDHLPTYLRLLDAAADGVDWRIATQEILHIDPEFEPVAARLAFDAHLARAQWMTREGYRFLSDSR